jgi:DNA-directed RNA polymerase specialized sigma54-like protein
MTVTEQHQHAKEEAAQHAANAFVATQPQPCASFQHTTGPMTMPTCFLAKHNPGVTLNAQQNLMPKVIVA